MSKLKITVLKRQDPADIFDELPVAKKDWMVPCGIYEDGQEYLLDSLTMPRASAALLGIPSTQTLGLSCMGATCLFSMRRGRR